MKFKKTKYRVDMLSHRYFMGAKNEGFVVKLYEQEYLFGIWPIGEEVLICTANDPNLFICLDGIEEYINDNYLNKDDVEYPDSIRMIL